MKFHPTAGPNTAHTTVSSWWSLSSASTIATPPASSAAITMATVRADEVIAHQYRGLR